MQHYFATDSSTFYTWVDASSSDEYVHIRFERDTVELMKKEGATANHPPSYTFTRIARTQLQQRPYWYRHFY